MIAGIIIIACLLKICAFFYYKNVYLLDKKLQGLPHPPGLPILGNALDFMSGKRNIPVLENYLSKYGDTVLLKFGPTRRMLVSSNFNVFQILKEDVKKLQRANELRILNRWLGSAGLNTADAAQWKNQRRVITPTLNYNILITFIDVFEFNAKMLVQQFAKHLHKDSVDICEMSSLCSVDIICEATMGLNVKAQVASKSAYVKNVKIMVGILIRRVFSFHKMFDWIYYFTEDYKRELKAVEMLDLLPESVLENRLNNLNSNQKTKTLLDHLLEAADQEEKLTKEEVRNNINSFLIAGHVNTGSGISFLLYCLANHPESQSKVFKEQQDIFGDDLERNATFQNLKDMKYLEMVVKESLRLYVPGAFVMKELTEDVECEGTVLPKGLSILFFFYGLLRNPKYFSEPDKFIPERFDNIDGKTPTAFIPFGIGPRNCVGQKYAMLLMKTLISRIIRNFEILPAIPTHELKLETFIVLTSANGICVRFKKRVGSL